jgi:hypothetical protein
MVCESKDHGFFEEPAMNPLSEIHPHGSRSLPLLDASAFRKQKPFRTRSG